MSKSPFRQLTLRQRVALFAIGLAAVTVIAIVVGATNASDEEPSAPSTSEIPLALSSDAAVASPETDQDPSDLPPADGNGERVIAKMLPDTKVLLGSPATIIDLTDIFEGTEIAEGGGPIDLEVVLNKKEKVVEAKIDGTRLTLTWDKIGKSEIILRAVNQQTGKIVDNKLQVEVWQPDYWKLVLTVIGGLGIFLLGMKNMSEGLQAVAGAGLRRMISAVTDNRLLATGTGVVVTMLIQSSSITTVMVVGFVNSGFMTLSQAIGVIMGANIGTTITGWILVMKIGKYGLPILGVAAFAYLFAKKDRLRYCALAIMGLGMVFFGLELMKDGFAVVKSLPDFERWFQSFSATTYLGVLKCASVGCLLTFIVQSSSATLGITISLAAIGVIPFETAAALVLGENIGTTITAWLASLGATINARRAAYFHVIFNMLGVIWITAIFIPIYMPFIKWLVGVAPSPETGLMVVTNPTEAIALTHTLFNVANMLLFLPLVPLMARLLERFVPQKEAEEKAHLTSLDVRMLETSAISIERSRGEVVRMAHGCDKLIEWVGELVAEEEPNEKLLRKAFHREEVLDTIQDEIVAFMADLLSGSIPHDVTQEARRQLRMADEYESISDYLVSVLKSHLKLQKAGLRIPESDLRKLLALNNRTAEYLKLISQGYELRRPEVITKAHSQGVEIIHHIKELRDDFIAKMSEEKFPPQIIVAYNAQLNCYRRVREHALNIAESVAGDK